MWFGVDSKNEHQKDMSFEKIELCAQITLTLSVRLYTVVNMIGGWDTYDHLISTRIFTLRINKIFI